MLRSAKSSSIVALLTGCLLAIAPPIRAGTSVLIWPLDPTIEMEQRNGAIWLENVGSEPVTLQIRVLAWDQQDYQDDYVTQNNVIATPPFTTIAQGKKQLVRLTATQPAPPGREQAFRILVDEIPVRRDDVTPVSNESRGGLRFQMRYSLPLFVYGTGLWRRQAPANRSSTQQAQPQLSWSIDESGGRRFLQVSNTGPGHARLSQVRLVSSDAPQAGATSTEIAPGLLGYVLPGRTMRWPLEAQVEDRGRSLQAQLMGDATPVVLSPH